MLNGHSPNCLTSRVCTFVWCQYLAGMSLDLRSVVFAPDIVQGLGKSGTTFYACFQYISERKPAMIIAENLPQLLQTKFAKDKESLLNWFEKDPLLVVEWIVLHRLPASRRLGRCPSPDPKLTQKCKNISTGENVGKSTMSNPQNCITTAKRPCRMEQGTLAI